MAADQQIDQPANFGGNGHESSVVDRLKGLIIDNASCGSEESLLFGLNVGIVRLSRGIEAKQYILNFALGESCHCAPPVGKEGRTMRVFRTNRTGNRTEEFVFITHLSAGEHRAPLGFG